MGRPILTAGALFWVLHYIHRKERASWAQTFLVSSDSWLWMCCGHVSLNPLPHHGLCALNLWAQIIPSSPKLFLTVNSVTAPEKFLRQWRRTTSANRQFSTLQLLLMTENQRHSQAALRWPHFCFSSKDQFYPKIQPKDSVGHYDANWTYPTHDTDWKRGVWKGLGMSTSGKNQMKLTFLKPDSFSANACFQVLEL